MKMVIELIVRFIRAGQNISARKRDFLGIFAVAFFGSVAVLGYLDLLPEMAPPAVAEAEESLPESPSASLPVAVSELPERIEIPKISLAAVIANPTTTDIGALDAELLKGAVRYPTSALLGEYGNVVLFGHSSYLPVVRNPAYKAFNGIQKLVAGDTITVYSSGAAYTYRVRSVAKEDANNAGIPLEISGRVLTLATCDSFGEKTDRFVVVADFVESHSVSN